MAETPTPRRAPQSAGGAKPPLSVDVDEWGDIHVVRVRGELDTATVGMLATVLRSQSCSTILVDLSQLEFCDARGLSALVSAKAEREHAGCHLRIVGARGIVRRLFGLTGLADLLAD